MKRLAKAFVRRMVANPVVWRVLDRFVLPAARYADWMHQKITARPITSQEESVHPLFKSETVLHGPSKGMFYRNTQFCCSAIAPKLLGSYEREVHPWIEEMLTKSYDGIADVGCAEGYYAVGFAWRKPGVRVYAYDISEQARAQCRALAHDNGVESQIDIRSFCDPGELGRLVNGKRFLILSDCEGYEKILFSPSNLPQLARSDIFIEVHDFMDITILPYLRELFAGTHEIRERESIDDLRKLDRYDYPELAGLPIHDRYRQIAEWRRRIMMWLYLTPKACA